MTIGKLLPNFRYYYDGLDIKPLIGGKLHSFKASDHSESGRKFLYADPDCTIPYPNPMIADGLGCFPDPAYGKKIYWKTDELYYLRLEDKDGNIIVDPDNFPDMQDIPDYQNAIFTNFINNSEFYYHQFPYFLKDSLPANIDNYIADNGWIFRRNNTSADITISFEEFDLGQTEVPYNPKYYIEYSKSSIGAGGETSSDFLQRISDVSSFSGENISFKIWAESDLNNIIEFIFIQHFGTGGTPSADNVILQAIQLNSGWNEYKIEKTSIPSTSGKVLGTNGDDCIYIGVRMPLNTLSEVKFTQLQLNYGDFILAYDNKTPEIEAEAKRSYQLPDPLPMTLLYDKLNAYNAYVYMSLDYGSQYHSDILRYNYFTKKYDLTNTIPVGVSISDYSDDELSEKYAYENGFIPHFDTQFQATSWFRRLFDRIGISYTKTNSNTDFVHYSASGNYIEVEEIENGAINEAFTDHGTNFVFQVITAGDPTHKHIEKITCPSPASSYTGVEFFTFGSVSGCKYLVNIRIDKKTTIPTGYDDYEKIALNISTGMDANAIATALNNQIFVNLGWNENWRALNVTGADVLLSTYTVGVLSQAFSDHGTGFTFTTITTGSATRKHREKITCTDASNFKGNEYFTFVSPSGDMNYIYIVIDGNVQQPPFGSGHYMPLILTKDMSANDVANTLANYVFSPLFFKLPHTNGLFKRIIDNGAGKDPDAATRGPREDGVYGDHVGTYQSDNFKYHSHTDNLSGSVQGHGGDLPETAEYYAGGQTGLAGGNETRPINVYVNELIKY